MSSPPSTLYLFLTGLGAGIPPALALVPWSGLGRRFFVLLSMIAIVSIGGAVVDRGLEVSYFHLGLAACLITYNIALPPHPSADPGRRTAGDAAEVRWGLRIAGAALAGSILCGALGLIEDSTLTRVQAARGPGGGVPPGILAPAVAVVSSWLLGTALVAMVLGHWYLVARGLSFKPLERITAALAALLGLRLLLTAAAVWTQWDAWRALAAEADRETAGFALTHGVFLASRGVFGFLVPALLVPWVWGCVRIRSNQSATGILYVLVAFLLVGEIIARHFFAARGLII